MVSTQTRQRSFSDFYPVACLKQPNSAGSIQAWWQAGAEHHARAGARRSKCTYPCCRMAPPSTRVHCLPPASVSTDRASHPPTLLPLCATDNTNGGRGLSCHGGHVCSAAQGTGTIQKLLPESRFPFRCVRARGHGHRGRQDCASRLKAWKRYQIRIHAYGGPVIRYQPALRTRLRQFFHGVTVPNAKGFTGMLLNES